MSITNLHPPDEHCTTRGLTHISFDLSGVNINTLSVTVNRVAIVTDGLLVSDDFTLTIHNPATNEYQIVLTPVNKLSKGIYSIDVNVWTFGG
jgi:hypothetical protein